MKKLFILLTIFIVLFVSCSTSSSSDDKSDDSSNETQNTDTSTTTDDSNKTTDDSNNLNKLLYKNNATDDMFSVTTNNDYTASTGDMLNGYIRTKGSSGIIGTWTRAYNKGYSNYRICELTFETDGTWSCVTSYPNKGEVDRDKGTYEVSEILDMLYIRIVWSTKEYILAYLVSDSYFCHQESGCPI